MKIYRIYHKVDGYKAINTKGSKLEESFINFGNDIDFSKHEGECFNWYGTPSDKISQFPFINGATPVFSNEVYKIVETLISPYSTSYNIKVEGLEYKIIDAHIFDGILNNEKSIIKYFKDGRVMNIKKYVFNSIPATPSIFKISELKTFTFVTEKVIMVLKDVDKLEGLDIEECEVV